MQDASVEQSDSSSSSLKYLTSTIQSYQAGKSRTADRESGQ